MAEYKDDLIEKIDQLTEQVRLLSKRVETLERGAPAGKQAAAPAQSAVSSFEEVPASGGTALSVGGVAALMLRGSVISLILLFALVLRTLTDGEVLSLGIGTALGIGYAALLEGVGWYMYGRKSSFAPIFSISGALLLAAVVLETHSGFGSISLVPAYMVLAAAGGVMAVISRKYRAAIPVCAGTVAVLVAGVPIGLQDGNFTALGIFLVAVNAVAFTAVDLPKSAWLRILTFTVTAVVILLWGYKLRFTLLSGAGLKYGILPGGPGSYYAIVAFYAIFYISLPAVAIWKNVTENKKPFDHVLPTLAGAWAYLACLMIVQASRSNVKLLGMAGVGAATCLLALAAVKGNRTGTRSRGTTTFAFPAAMLLAMSFRDVSGQSVAALAILSWGALSLAWLSNKWTSAGVRVTAYFLQLTVLGAASILLLMSPAGRNTFFTVLNLAVIAGAAFVHYRLTRRTDPPGQNPYFTRFDRSDTSGVIPLLVSVGAAFLGARAVLFTLAAGSAPIFQAGETMILNFGALALFTTARLRKSAELKWVGVAVTAAGGGKVFLYDLFKVRGVPGVLSVLSFVIAAAFGSWVLSRWQRTGERTGA